MQLATLKVGARTYANVCCSAPTPTDLYFKTQRRHGQREAEISRSELQRNFTSIRSSPPKRGAAGRGRRAVQETLAQAAADRVKERVRVAEAAAAQENLPTRSPTKSFLNKPAPELVVEKWLAKNRHP